MTLPKFPASADVAPLPTSTEAVAALALVRCYRGAIAGTSLSLVNHLDYVEDAVVKRAVANKKQATLLQYLSKMNKGFVSSFK